MLTRSDKPLSILGVLALALTVATCKGDMGDPGVAGVTGPTGPTGPAGPAGRVVTARRTFVFTAIPTTGCTNTGATSVTITTTGPGVVVLFARGLYSIDHTSGISDQVNIFIGTTATDCPGSYGEVGAIILPGPLPTSSSWLITNTASRTFTVAAGTFTYFLNTQQFSGGATNNFGHGYIEAIFYPS